MEDFTPLSGLFGGMLIGLAATMLLLLNGRIAGISGIVGGMLVSRIGGLFGWRTAFIVGLLLGASGYALAMGGVPVEIEASLPALVVAGLLVGFGTRLGSGCTSGHGVCGIGRMSKRSIAATAVFFTVAIATVFLVRHVVGGVA
ncbi:MAG: YeeE/YedE family protein [Rubrobacter sp.]|nr:YeeE/YedE family protein [Rubrobacter sp.]